MTASRFLAHDHWSSDMLVGSVLGFSIGTHIFRTHCDREFEPIVLSLTPKRKAAYSVRHSYAETSANELSSVVQMARKSGRMSLLIVILIVVPVTQVQPK